MIHINRMASLSVFPRRISIHPVVYCVRVRVNCANGTRHHALSRLMHVFCVFVCNNLTPNGKRKFHSTLSFSICFHFVNIIRVPCCFWFFFLSFPLHFLLLLLLLFGGLSCYLCAPSSRSRCARVALNDSLAAHSECVQTQSTIIMCRLSEIS